MQRIECRIYRFFPCVTPPDRFFMLETTMNNCLPLGPKWARPALSPSMSKLQMIPGDNQYSSKPSCLTQHGTVFDVSAPLLTAADQLKHLTVLAADLGRRPVGRVANPRVAPGGHREVRAADHCKVDRTGREIIDLVCAKNYTIIICGFCLQTLRTCAATMSSFK